MNVSAVNCTPIKPQVSFGNDSDTNYNQIINKTQELNDQLVHSDQIKKPLAIAGSLGLAALAAYVTGQKIASPFAKKIIGKNTENAKTLACCFEDTLKRGSSAVREKASKLMGDTSTKTGKLKNTAGEILRKTEKFARNAYKKVAYFGIDDNIEAADKAVKAFQNIGGCVAVPAAIAITTSKDVDGNGVSDMLQTEANPYDKTRNKMDKYMHNAYVLTELIDTIL